MVHEPIAGHLFLSWQDLWPTLANGVNLRNALASFLSFPRRYFSHYRRTRDPHPLSFGNQQADDMMANVIVWDIETVPDLRGFAAANGLTASNDDEIRSALGDKFPKHIFHSIVCIGALIAHREGEKWQVDALGAPHCGERSEKELISSFVERIAELKLGWSPSMEIRLIFRYCAIPPLLTA
jgi:hypothetical protein